MSRFNFRAWNKKESKMEFIHILNIGDDCVLPNYTYEQAWELEDCILMQSTGLKDKNGKLIYEGDILKVDLGTYSSVPNIPYYHTVKWESGTTHCGWGIAASYSKVSESVGNVYENPKLLEEAE